MKVLIAGLTGTGKTTLAKNIAGKFKLKFMPSSSLFREFANQNTSEQGWWTRAGLKFIKERLNSDFDERFDKYLLELVDSEDDFIIDSWTMPWLYKEEALRIYLTAPFDERVNRIMLRDNHDFDSAKSSVLAKDTETKMIYLQKYQFDIVKDLNVFDLIINTQYLNEKQITDLVCDFVKSYKEYFKQ
jgi:predicted cytidylate kinase